MKIFRLKGVTVREVDGGLIKVQYIKPIPVVSLSVYSIGIGKTDGIKLMGFCLKSETGKS